MRATPIAFIWSLLLLSSSAQAEMSAEQYIQQTGTKHTLDTTWLYGVQNGFAWANAANESHGLPPLYCQPRNLALTQDQVIDILDNYIKAGKATLQSEVSLVLLMALKNAFPCSR